ncbi:MAG: FHA domain-containing protein [Deltaproteobacteria bacterium]|nr:FHA domain-containing protein [Deltaproteobacteria bacterium]
MPNIFIVKSDGSSYSYLLLKNETIIGRGKSNDIVFTDSTVSRNHAKIIKSEKDYLITDLGSYNGTKLNDIPVQNAILKDKDQIKIGHNKMTFFHEDEDNSKESGSVILIPDEDEKDDQKIVKSSAQTEDKDLKTLLVKGHAPSARKFTGEDSSIRKGITDLERSNKVLFVLYEISKQLNSISDFGELLHKIMDLIFMIIDADYGFLILTGKQETDELIPVVVKYKNENMKLNEKLTASRSIINRVIQDKVSLLTSNAMQDSRLAHAQSLFLQQIRSAMCVPLWKKDKIIGVIQLWSIRIDNHFTQDDLQLLQTISSQMAMIIEQASLNEQIREEENLRRRLERFHSPQVIDMIIRSGQETKDDIMEPKDLTATILFTDIIGFTPLSERMPPREINMLLNLFFSRMTDIIFEYGGTLDKYIGDAIMAVFGAPMEKEGDAERAILAALKMREELKKLMETTPPDRQFNIRIGINTGRVVAGNIGSPKRMDYTVIGDAVNVASRLESIGEPDKILIGEATYKAVKDKFRIKKVGAKRVKGKTSDVMVYEVFGLKS